MSDRSMFFDEDGNRWDEISETADGVGRIIRPFQPIKRDPLIILKDRIIQFWTGKCLSPTHSVNHADEAEIVFSAAVDQSTRERIESEKLMAQRLHKLEQEVRRLEDFARRHCPTDWAIK